MDNSLCCSWIGKNQVWFTWHHTPCKIHQVYTFVWDCCPRPCPPLSLSAHIQHQVLHVALPRAEEVAVVVVRVGGLGPVVAVLTTPVISITGVQTALEAGNRDQVVSGNTPTPAIKVLAIKEYITKIIYFFSIPSRPYVYDWYRNASRNNGESEYRNDWNMQKHCFNIFSTIGCIILTLQGCKENWCLKSSVFLYKHLLKINNPTFLKLCS